MLGICEVYAAPKTDYANAQGCVEDLVVFLYLKFYLITWRSLHLDRDGILQESTSKCKFINYCMWSGNLISERAHFEKRGTERNPNQGINGFGAEVDKKQWTETSYKKGAEQKKFRVYSENPSMADINFNNQKGVLELSPWQVHPSHLNWNKQKQLIVGLMLLKPDSSFSHLCSFSWQ